jgi:signal transduction histidine kinase
MSPSSEGLPPAGSETSVADEVVHLLLDVAVIANQAETLEQALHATLRRLCEHSRWQVGHARLLAADGRLVPTDVWFLEEGERFEDLRQAAREAVAGLAEGALRPVVESGRARWIEDLSHAPDFAGDRRIAAGLKAAIAVPILAGRRVVGVLEFYSTQALAPNPRLLDVFSHIGTQLGQVVERRDLERQIADLTDREQRRIGRELHDRLGQQITGIGMLARSLERRLAASGAPEAEAAAALAEVARGAQTQVRALARGLLPVEVDAGGLMNALADLARQTETLYSQSCVFRCERPVEMEDNFTATHLYRMAQEAVHNAVKHAEASRVEIRLESREGRLILSVSDDGRGLPEDPPEPGGLGLRILRYRASLLDARLTVHSSPGRGTTVSCSLTRE